uniref:G_PROTEIN_RECEP_F1_2 domain-containing protein n=1 Tax=Panagrellus redivivus TaxID=6233 RepID=A0A7E4V2N4_PANRE
MDALISILLNDLQFKDMSWGDVFSCVLVIYVEPFLCSAGFILNVTCIVVFLTVWSHGYFRKASLLFYLIALSICNALQLLLSIFVIVLPAAEQFISPDIFPREIELLRSVNAETVRYAYPLLMAANYASLWILSLICAQRYQSVCHPWNAWKHRLAFVRNSKMCIVVVVFTAVALNVIRFWELEKVEGTIRVTPLRYNTWYKIIQEGIIFGCIVYGFPMAVLLWFNYNTLKLIRVDERHRCRPSAEHRTAMMTVFVFIFFFLCTTLAASIRLAIILTGNLFASNDYIWLIDLSNLLINVNALIMPIVCFVFTRGFRDLFFVVRYAPSSESVELSMKSGKLLLKERRTRSVSFAAKKTFTTRSLGRTSQ